MSILIARDDGVVVLKQAERVPLAFVETVEQLLDTLGVRPREPQQQCDEPDGGD